MSNPSVSFGKGLQNNLPNITNGQILIATDTGNLFFDQNNKRIQVNADKAVKDGNGKNIANTYELKGSANTALATAQAYTDGKLDEYVPDYVNTAISGLLSLANNTVSLPENANLNDYILGTDSYYATVAICATCLNSPTTLGFRLIVLEGYTSSRTIQILIDGNGDVYQRARTEEDWTQWSCINKQYVVATSAPANTNVLWLKPNV